MNDKERKKFLREAEGWESMRDQLGRTQLDNLKYIKGQAADWYVALAAVCFAIGGISISLAKNDIRHPALFWWGSVLLIANGVFIFFIRKKELDNEAAGFPTIKQKEADLWTMSKVAREHADGDTSRVNEFTAVAARFTDDYEKHSAPKKWWQWTSYVLQACMLDIVFGFLLFPILLLASQLPNYLRIKLGTYTLILCLLLALYVVYLAYGAIKAIKQKKVFDRADRQIKAEVDRH